MTNMSIQPLWLTHFIEILLDLEFQLKIFIVGVFSYKAHFRPQISSNEYHPSLPILHTIPPSFHHRPLIPRRVVHTSVILNGCHNFELIYNRSGVFPTPPLNEYIVD